MIEIYTIIIYIVIGIFVNYKFNKTLIKDTIKIFPILSKFIICYFVLLWPAIICSKIEDFFDNRINNKTNGKK